MSNSQYQVYLLHAMNLAETYRGFCAPNPCVGALIVDKAGSILAEGVHRGVGLPHAEVDALEKLPEGTSKGAVMYVTLEPCSHYGRTPPCSDAIIRSGIKNVVYAYRDPNPLVCGKGVAQLHAAGIKCEYFPLKEIDCFYESYCYWRETKKPLVTAKIAMTLDGKTAGKDGLPIRITGDEINTVTHQQRKKHDAILTTVKTILIDDPRLDARYNGLSSPKPLYVLDQRLEFPLHAKVFSTAKSITVFYAGKIKKSSYASLIALGVRCIQVDKNNDDLNLEQIIRFIGQDGMHTLWVETGGKCFSAFVKNSLLKRAFIYLAPRWLGEEGLSAFPVGFGPDLSFKKIHWEQIGQDVCCELYF